MPVIEKEIDPVLFRLDGVIERAPPHDPQIRYGQIESAWRTGFGADLTGQGNRRFKCQFLEPRPHLRRELRFHEHSLGDAAPIAKYRKRDLARGA